ncbi:MAG: hypothetical protein ACFCD0_04355, partial [Gemmataceae bacterium]
AEVADAEVPEQLERLRAVHESLWACREGLRGCERNGDFGEKFVELARSQLSLKAQKEELITSINAQIPR